MTWQGYATFPGILAVGACDYTRSRGITPDTAMLECSPQPDYEPIVGPLTFVWTNGVITYTIPMSDCRIVDKVVRSGGAGQVWTLAIQDRRWRWNLGWINGNYNITMEDGAPDPDRRASPYVLAQLLLEAMGETGYDISAVPLYPLPEVNWIGANPAKELQNLCDLVGLEIVLDLNDRVAIVQPGIGAGLPGDSVPFPTGEDSLTIDPPESPDTVFLIGGPIRYDDIFRLEAIGLDIDGVRKPIDKLSYMPKGGWKNATPPDFITIGGNAIASRARDLARQTVYRWYRLVWQDVPIRGYNESLTSLRQILPIHDCRAKYYVDSWDRDKVKQLPPLITGVFIDNETIFKNSAPDTQYKLDDFSIDREHAVVQFSRYLCRMSSDEKTFLPALLNIRIAVSVRNPKTWSWMRYGSELQLNNPPMGAPTVVITHEEMILDYLDGKPVNKAALDAEAQYYLLGEAKKYQLKIPQVRTYGGLMPFSLDGAIQQISWHVGGGSPATTTISRNTEHSTVVTPYPARRIWEQMRGGALKRLNDSTANAAAFVENINRRYRRPL